VDRLSSQLLALLATADGRDMTFGEILATFRGRGHAMAVVFLSFPLCLPMGIPVLTSSIGLMLAFVGLCMALDRELWIPRRLRAKEISHERLVNTVERLRRATDRMERWFHPRLFVLASHGTVLRLHGVVILVAGLIETLPLPFPFHNMVAAVPVLLLGLSLLERDGMLVIVSYLSAIPAVLYYGGLLFLGREGLKFLAMW
jgi:hypothetical protein